MTHMPTPDRLSSAKSRAPTMLVVEDEALVCMPIAEFLRDCGFNVLAAADADEAIGLVDAGDPVDVVFSDVRVPGGKDGFALVRRIRDHHPQTPVLLTSGYNTARDAGVAGLRVLAKPYFQAQVLDRLRHLLRQAG
jgi:CheY-like chemotaxis protein